MALRGYIRRSPYQLKNATEQSKRAMKRALVRLGIIIRDDAKSRAPVRTGGLRASIYTATSDESGYLEAVGEGQSLNPYLRGAAPAQPRSDMSVAVGVGAHYGEAVEDGTLWVAPRPFLRPAFEENRGKLPHLVKEEMGKLDGR